MVALHFLKSKLSLADGAYPVLPLIRRPFLALGEGPDTQMLFLPGHEIGVDTLFAGYVIVHHQGLDTAFQRVWVEGGGLICVIE